MKTEDQILRYISHCEFSDEDWQMVSSYCREAIKNQTIRKARHPISQSTYGQFIDWIDNGLGSGDMVSYGKTMGVIGSSTPERTFLAAYCDYDGRLLIKEMDVMEPARLKRLDAGRVKQLKSLIYAKGVCYIARLNQFTKLYTPNKNSLVTIDNDGAGVPDVGIFLESDDKMCYFLALLRNGKLKMNYWLEVECTAMREASKKDIKRLFDAAADAGLSYNSRMNQFVRLNKRMINNTYWYLNECFDLVQDKDNGSKKHELRFKSGNYFVDYGEGLSFMDAVRNLRKGER